MNDEHQMLLEEWKSLPHHLNKGFIYDGIIDQDRWAQSPRKILFINKEAYDDDGSDGLDLRELIRCKCDGRPSNGAYKVIANWAYALHHASPDPSVPFPEWSQIDPEGARESLLSCSVMNIKKSGGKTSSDHQDLQAYVEKDGDLIKRQVELINPDIIVCGHVWYLIKHLWPNPVNIYDEVLEVDGRVIIDFWHPSNRYPDEMNYYALAALIQNGRVLHRFSADAPRSRS
jgi:hypothetical protein